MNSTRALIATAVSTFVLGLVSARAITQAQPAHVPPAYVIAEVDIKDPAAFKTYSAQVPGTLKPYGGEFLVRGGQTASLEGPPPRQRVVVIRFDSVAQARDWYNSPAYGALRPIRQQAAETRNFIVEGVKPAP